MASSCKAIPNYISRVQLYTSELIEANQPMMAPKIRLRIVKTIREATKSKATAKKSRTGRKKTVCPSLSLPVDPKTVIDSSRAAPSRLEETSKSIKQKITVLDDILVKTNIFMIQGRKFMNVTKIGCDTPVMTVFLDQLTPDTEYPIIDLTDETEDMNQ